MDIETHVLCEKQKGEEALILGCADGNDSITIGLYNTDKMPGEAKIVDGQTLVDGKNEYSGELGSRQLRKMGDKTLRLAESFMVTFVDGQGNTLKEEIVENGKAATAPDEPTREGYTFDGWDEDFSNVISNLTVTAKWKCAHEAADRTFIAPVNPTCERTGLKEHEKCERCGSWILTEDGEEIVIAEDDEKTYSDKIVIPALGHDWGEAGYTWADDNSTVTAKRVCSRDGKHIEEETVDTTSEVTQQATSTDAEKTAWTSEAFTNPAFSVQTKTGETADALGHEWEFMPFIWTGNKEDGYTGAKGYYECKHDGDHIKKVSAEITEVVTDPSCESEGKTTYTATIAEDQSPDGVKYEESKDAKIKEALGHDWGDWEVTRKATLTEQGEKKRTCKRDGCGKTQTEAIPMLIDIEGAEISGKTLEEGTDYTASYQNNEDVGVATLTITGDGSYGGTIAKTFRINPKGTPITKLKKGKKMITVKWKKQAAKMSASRITGYQIQLATNKKFTKGKKTVTVKSYKKVSKKVPKLKAKKKYFVRVRTFKTVSGVKYYSPWSKVKAVKAR